VDRVTSCLFVNYWMCAGSVGNVARLMKMCHDEVVSMRTNLTWLGVDLPDQPENDPHRLCELLGCKLPAEVERN
jgi:hypothetical protein